jgi:hypothetical protein
MQDPAESDHAAIGAQPVEPAMNRACAPGKSQDGENRVPSRLCPRYTGVARTSQVFGQLGSAKNGTRIDVNGSHGAATARRLVAQLR